MIHQSPICAMYFFLVLWWWHRERFDQICIVIPFCGKWKFNRKIWCFPVFSLSFSSYHHFFIHSNCVQKKFMIYSVSIFPVLLQIVAAATTTIENTSKETTAKKMECFSIKKQPDWKLSRFWLKCVPNSVFSSSTIHSIFNLLLAKRAHSMGKKICQDENFNFWDNKSNFFSVGNWKAACVINILMFFSVVWERARIELNISRAKNVLALWINLLNCRVLHS